MRKPMKIKILLTESIDPIAKQILEAEGYQVDLIGHAPDEIELLEKLPNYHVVGIRSKTEITEKVIQNNKHLLCIGCFCIGTNQVNLKTTRNLGIPVFNAPHSNTRSVAELIISEMIVLARHLGDRNMQCHRGDWIKSSNGAHEVRGKTLGIVGYGHIGSQLSVLAEALGLKVYFYDIIKKLPLGNAQSVSSLEELLKVSDFVSLHVPKTPETHHMIGIEQLKMMKKGSYLLNASRGTVVILEDLAQILKEKHLAGAAIDVFPVEPASNKEKLITPIQGMPNVILTPHIGGSTEEAQYSIGIEVSETFKKYLQIGTTSGAVNFPNVDLPFRNKGVRLINVHKNEPGVLGEINGLLSQEGVNIEGQYLSTDENIGYMVMDMDIVSKDADSLFQKINSLKRNIRTRLLENKP